MADKKITTAYKVKLESEGASSVKNSLDLVNTALQSLLTTSARFDKDFNKRMIALDKASSFDRMTTASMRIESLNTALSGLVKLTNSLGNFNAKLSELQTYKSKNFKFNMSIKEGYSYKVNADGRKLDKYTPVISPPKTSSSKSSGIPTSLQGVMRTSVVGAGLLAMGVIMKKSLDALLNISLQMENVSKQILLNREAYSNSIAYANSLGIGDYGSILTEKQTQLFGLNLFGKINKEMLVGMSILGVGFNSSLQDIYRQAGKFSDDIGYQLLNSVYGKSLAEAFLKEKLSMRGASSAEREAMNIPKNMNINMSDFASETSRFARLWNTLVTITKAFVYKMGIPFLGDINKIMSGVIIHLGDIYNSKTGKDTDRAIYKAIFAFVNNLFWGAIKSFNYLFYGALKSLTSVFLGMAFFNKKDIDKVTNTISQDGMNAFGQSIINMFVDSYNAIKNGLSLMFDRQSFSIAWQGLKDFGIRFAESFMDTGRQISAAMGGYLKDITDKINPMFFDWIKRLTDLFVDCFVKMFWYIYEKMKSWLDTPISSLKSTLKLPTLNENSAGGQSVTGQNTNSGLSSIPQNSVVNNSYNIFAKNTSDQIRILNDLRVIR